MSKAFTSISGAAGTQAWRVGPNAGFWITGLAYFVSMAFSTVPAPLYVLYQRRDGLNQLTIATIFAAYAVGVMASLFLAGHLSDWFGRRRVLLVGLFLDIVSAALFLVGAGAAALIAARLVCGVATGVMTGTITAYIVELHTLARPGRSRGRADLIASAALMGGLGAGALMAGLLAQFTHNPLQAPYWVFMLLLATVVVGVWLAPETVAPPEERPTYRPQRIAVPYASRSRYFAATGAALALFAMLALFSSVSASFMAGTFGLHSHALAGLVTFLVYAGGAAAQTASMRLPTQTLLSWGLRSMLAGLAILAGGVWWVHFATFLVAGVVIGMGTGILFKGCVSTVMELAPPEARGETMAGLFLTGYIGLSIPIIALGGASLVVDAKTAVLGFTTVFFLVILAVRRRLLAPGAAVAVTS